jgi:hypothetical protein
MKLARAANAQLPSKAPPHWGSGCRAVQLKPWHLPQGRAPAPVPILTDIGGLDDTPLSWYAESLQQFIDEGLRAASSHDQHWRELPLLAVPFVGSGAGGKRSVSGAHMRDLLELLAELARDVDIALVLHDEAAYSAAQAHRNPELATAQLPGRLRETADDLALRAGRGELVLFLGAGISSSAGFPLWNELLDRMGERAGLNDSERGLLASVPALDAATVIEARLGEGLLKPLIAESLSSTVYGLGHSLSASLAFREAVTTNYDTLYETAYRDCGRSISILPHDPRPRADGWILKVHGCVTKSDDIVITRRDYLRYDSTRSALFGIVQAMLITRHIVFLGFSLKDDNFYALIDAVRRAIDGDNATQVSREQFGTVILQSAAPFSDELWKRDFGIVAALNNENLDLLVGSRRIEIFLDYLGYRAYDASAHILDDRYESALTSEQRKIKQALLRVQRSLANDTFQRFSALRKLLAEYGGGPSPDEFSGLE